MLAAGYKLVNRADMPGLGFVPMKKTIKEVSESCSMVDRRRRTPALFDLAPARRHFHAQPDA